MKRFLYDFLSKNAMLLCLLFCTSANLSAQNNAVSLNGTSQSAYANPLLPSANEITMEGWFNWTGSTGNNQVLFYNGNSGSSGYGLMIIPGDANKLNIVCGGWVVQTTGITIPTGKWTHIALTLKVNLFTVYLNGVSQYSGNLGYYYTAGSYPAASFMVGGNAISSAEYFKGSIDEVRVWNKSRSAKELFSNAAIALTGSESGLEALYHFDSESDGVTADAGPNGYHLTVNGAPTYVTSTALNTLIRQQMYASGATATSATVRWMADPHAFVDGYKIYADTTANPTTAVGATLSRTDTTFTLSGLTPNTVYYFTARSTSSTDTSDYYRMNAVSTFAKAGRSGSFFDGAHYKANGENIPIGNSSYTIETWIKPNSMGARGIVGWGSFGESNGRANALRLSDNGIINYWWSNDLSIETGDITGNWHHVAATYDGTTRKIYLDGILKGSDTPTAPDVEFSYNLTIGKTNYDEFFDGEMDELRIWNVARTEAEIQANAGIPLTGQESGLVTLTRCVN